jgi:hypothetical protein
VAIPTPKAWESLHSDDRGVLSARRREEDAEAGVRAFERHGRGL